MTRNDAGTLVLRGSRVTLASIARSLARRERVDRLRGELDERRESHRSAAARLHRDSRVRLLSEWTAS